MYEPTSLSVELARFEKGLRKAFEGNRMIGPLTVLILGAGASSPYGLPTGAKVRELALKKVRGEGEELKATIFRVTELPRSVIDQFFQELAKPAFFSVDQLLEKRPGNSEFQKIGKTTIAEVLRPFLSGKPAKNPTEDWIQFLWRRMSAGTDHTFESLRRNRLKIVTFNFDTCLERALAQNISDMFSDATLGSAMDYVRSNTLHVHGVLDPQPAPPRTVPRYDGSVNDNWLRKVSQDIGLVHDDRDEVVLQEARNLVASADIVCFLGFGYHEFNLRKLGFPMLKANKMLPLYCSACGHGENEREDFRQRIGATLDLTFGKANEDCALFLQNHHILRAS